VIFVPFVTPAMVGGTAVSCMAANGLVAAARARGCSGPNA